MKWTSYRKQHKDHFIKQCKDNFVFNLECQVLWSDVNYNKEDSKPVVLSATTLPVVVGRWFYAPSPLASLTKWLKNPEWKGTAEENNTHVGYVILLMNIWNVEKCLYLFWKEQIFPILWITALNVQLLENCTWQMVIFMIFSCMRLCDFSWV